jgi:hypothetical protein
MPRDLPYVHGKGKVKLESEGFWTLSVVWNLKELKKHNVLETASVSFFR